MKKIIPSILLVIILFSVFLPKNYVYAYPATDYAGETKKSTFEEIERTITAEKYNRDSEKGSSYINGKEHGYKIPNSVMNSAVHNVIKIFNIIPTLAKTVMDLSVNDEELSEEDEGYEKEFSIQRLVYNKIDMFKVNFFSSSDSESKFTKDLKKDVAKLYVAMRNVAIAAMLVILIYTGIRMAISSVAESKAKYKQMLISWLSAFVILMTLPYIMSAISLICDSAMALLEKIVISLGGDEVRDFEAELINARTEDSSKGFSLLISSIAYWVVVFYQIKFYYMYFKRIFSTAFLIGISPLVIVQHAFNKASGEGGGAFSAWIKELALNIAMQPLHAIIYSVFISITFNIMTTAPLLSIIFFATMSMAERVVRGMLKVKNTTTVTSMADNFSAKDMADKAEDVAGAVQKVTSFTTGA